MEMSLQKYIDRKEIRKRVKEIAEKISSDYRGKTPVMVGVLKGAVVFMTDLIREIDLPVELDFIAVSSYGSSTKTSGIVRILKDLDQNIEDREVIIIEDIIDTGLTLQYLKETLYQRKPSSLCLAALLDKPERRQVNIKADYVGINIPDKFVVGYGLDFNEQYRNLPDIFIME